MTDAGQALGHHQVTVLRCSGESVDIDVGPCTNMCELHVKVCEAFGNKIYALCLGGAQLPSTYMFPESGLPNGCNVITAVAKAPLQLVYEGFTIKDVRLAGYTGREVVGSGFTLKDLFNGGYRAHDLFGVEHTCLEIERAGFTIRDLRHAGFTATELLAAGFPARDLNRGGYTIQDLVNSGHTASQVELAGYSKDLLHLRDFRIDGMPALQAAGLGYTAWCLRIAGYSAKSLQNTGCFTPSDLKSAGFTLQDMQDVVDGTAPQPNPNGDR